MTIAVLAAVAAAFIPSAAMTAWADTIQCEASNNCEGTGDDTMYGTNGSEDIDGNGGDDTIYGRAGDFDFILAGDGNDL